MKKTLSEPMRLFVAMELSDTVREEAWRISRQWDDACPRGNFSRKENLHVTLRFLGECDPGKVEKIQSAVQWAALLASPFSLRLSRAGAFAKGNESVLWLGLAGETEPLRLLHDELDQALEPLGFLPERVYRPHLTLARQVKDVDVKELCTGTLVKPVGMKVDHITLMHSTRVDGVLTYLPLKRAPFGG